MFVEANFICINLDLKYNCRSVDLELYNIIYENIIYVNLCLYLIFYSSLQYLE